MDDSPRLEGAAAEVRTILPIDTSLIRTYKRLARERDAAFEKELKARAALAAVDSASHFSRRKDGWAVICWLRCVRETRRLDQELGANMARRAQLLAERREREVQPAVPDVEGKS